MMEYGMHKHSKHRISIGMEHEGKHKGHKMKSIKTDLKFHGDAKKEVFFNPLAKYKKGEI